MLDILKEHLSVSSFADLIPDTEALEELFHQMQADRKHLTGEIHAFEAETERIARNLKIWKKQLTVLEKEAAGWEDTLPKLEKLAGGGEYKVKKMRCELKIDALKKKLARYSPYKKLKSALIYANYRQNIRAMDFWAEELGAWFESGALGKGEVRYNGKLFSFK